MSRYLIRRMDGVRLSMGGMEVRLTVPSDRTSGVFAVTEHGSDERRLIPPHRHQHEDECSFVLEGTIGARVGDDELEAAPGSCTIAPRGLFHAYWNPTDQPAGFLTVITPGRLERFFEEFEHAFAADDPDVIAARRRQLGPEYGLEYEPTWIPGLTDRYGVLPLGQ
jgi:mannose-6-phosphate isomerase-like protein (cupin superfamily)